MKNTGIGLPGTGSKYTSIYNCPIGIFDEIGRTKEFSLLGPGATEDDYAKIFDQWEEKYEGLRNYTDYMEAIIESINHYHDALVSGEKYKLTLARVKEIDAEEMLDGGGGCSISDTAAYLTKFMGVPVRLHDTTVDEFYSYVKLAKETATEMENKMNRKDNQNG